MVVGSWAMRTFRQDNKAFERWLARQCHVVKKDLDRKHERMTKKPAFVFLRATYFRWARRIEAICPELADAPPVLAVGDIHLENYGTWRDADGRWIWGVNDFDEAAVMPYAFDLVRLVTSIQLAPNIKIDPRAIARAVLQGYREGLEAPGPMFLDRPANSWIRPYVGCSNQCRQDFRNEIDGLKNKKPSHGVRRGLISALPHGAVPEKYCQRTAGGGSLGRPRFVVVATWRGGRVVREAKAIVPSAWIWAHGGKRGGRHPFLQLSNGRFRSPDPFLDVRGRFLYRRLAADSRKIDLDKLGAPLRLRLVQAMGAELASIHVAKRGSRKKILKDIEDRPDDWLVKASAAAVRETKADRENWLRGK
jgi:uncharacterized protein DUF2252